ncbi:MAG: hypothetical protein DMF95_18735 [Acidobacteria bacterium]|nr:MAG: hypothetical protein DMF96_23840 [Acidobacteriota bacterium]PYR46261.1 MAG: hypothetical protein DMF95_18735 [Acidobacteriota bacterium]
MISEVNHADPWPRARITIEPHLEGGPVARLLRCVYRTQDDHNSASVSAGGVDRCHHRFRVGALRNVGRGPLPASA